MDKVLPLKKSSQFKGKIWRYHQLLYIPSGLTGGISLEDSVPWHTHSIASRSSRVRAVERLVDNFQMSTAWGELTGFFP